MAKSGRPPPGGARFVRALLAGLLLAGGSQAALADAQGAPAEAQPPTATAQAGAAVSAAPESRVEAFHAALLTAMRSERDFDVRAQRLSETMASAFDFATIARICLGKTRRELEAEQRAEFEAVLSQLIVATYVDRFDSDRGQRFEIVEVDTEKPKRALVRARVMRANGDAVALDYYFRGPRVFNVVADGVSDLSLRRADYNAVLKEHGYAHLLADLRRQLAETRQSFSEVDG